MAPRTQSAARPRLLMLVIRLLFRSFTPCQAVIGLGVSFGHRERIFFAPTVRGEALCSIRHQATLAHSVRAAMSLRDDVQLGAGANLVGPLVIGDHVGIGTNAVVLHDIPSRATAVGIPAGVVKRRAAFDGSDAAAMRE